MFTARFAVETSEHVSVERRSVGKTGVLGLKVVGQQDHYLYVSARIIDPEVASKVEKCVRTIAYTAMVASTKRGGSSDRMSISVTQRKAGGPSSIELSLEASPDVLDILEQELRSGIYETLAESNTRSSVKLATPKDDRLFKNALAV